jgi:hypothetical protein
MNCKEFVTAFKDEMAWQMQDYFSSNPRTVTGTEIRKLSLSEEQLSILKKAVESCLLDTYYTVLLGLDGSAGIGNMQHTFKIKDEEGNILSECGELEAEAYEQFHGDAQQENA